MLCHDKEKQPVTEVTIETRFTDNNQNQTLEIVKAKREWIRRKREVFCLYL